MPKKITQSPRYSAAIIAGIARLPKPEAEVRFHPVRKWRFDFAWPEQKIALEIEGGLFVNGGHSRGGAHMRDQEKFNHAAALGWLVFRTTPKEVYSHTTLGLIAKAYKDRTDPDFYLAEDVT